MLKSVLAIFVILATPSAFAADNGLGGAPMGGGKPGLNNGPNNGMGGPGGGNGGPGFFRRGPGGPGGGGGMGGGMGGGQQGAGGPGGPGGGNGGPGGRRANSPCAKDVEKLCKSFVGKGPQAIQSCLSTKENDLSPACKQMRSSQKNGKSGLLSSCKEDTNKFCSSVPSNGKPGPMMACLRRNQDKLSASCKAGMTEMASKMKKGNDSI